MKYQAEMPDEKLIQFYLSNNPAALATLSDLYKDRIYNAIYTMVQDKYLAEDIFRQVFIRIINNLMTGKNAEDGNFLSWAINIAQQLCIEHNCKARLGVPIETIDLKDGHSVDLPLKIPAGGAMYYDSHTKIRSMIDMLPEGQREVIVLNHYAGLCFRDIAGKMKCSVSNALDMMKIGLNNLRKLMAEQEMLIN